jgi:hypothetical protein
MRLSIHRGIFLDGRGKCTAEIYCEMKLTRRDFVRLAGGAGAATLVGAKPATNETGTKVFTNDNCNRWYIPPVMDNFGISAETIYAKIAAMESTVVDNEDGTYTHTFGGRPDARS